MELLTIEIINPKARKILEGLADMHLIKILNPVLNSDSLSNVSLKPQTLPSH